MGGSTAFSFVDIYEFDFADIDGLDDAQTRAFFERRARAAKPGQLAGFLYGLEGNGEEDLDVMVLQFVDRRMSTIAGMRDLKLQFDDVLAPLREGNDDA